VLNESTPQVRVTDADAVCMHIMSINGIIELRKYGVATSSRRFKIIGLFCRISSLLQGSFVKETYHFKEPTTRSHPICASHVLNIHPILWSQKYPILNGFPTF